VAPRAPARTWLTAVHRADGPFQVSLVRDVHVELRLVRAVVEERTRGGDGVAVEHRSEWHVRQTLRITRAVHVAVVAQQLERVRDARVVHEEVERIRLAVEEDLELLGAGARRGGRARDPHLGHARG